MPLNLLADGFGSLSIKQAFQLCGPDLKATNTKDDPQRIKPRRLEGVQIRGDRIDVRLAPASWNVIQMDAH